MKINDIRDPALFQRLVHKLYVAERGHEFQVVDDSGGDRGNDGYDFGRHLLLSIYCPERPQTADYRHKARSDLTKAIALAGTPGYQIDGWIFITPTALREPLQSELRALAESSGLTASFVADAHLEDMYRRHTHLHDEFPELEYPKVAEVLAAIQKQLGEATTRPSQGSVPVEATNVDSELDSVPSMGVTHGFESPILRDLAKRIVEGDPAAASELERFRLEATDIRDRLGALLVELGEAADKLDVMRGKVLAAEGLQVATAAGALAEQAVFGAHLAYVSIFDIVREQIEVVADAAFAARSGFFRRTAAELTSKQAELTAATERVESLLREAVQRANESGDIIAQYIVALRCGQVHSQLFAPHMMAAKLRGEDASPAKGAFLAQIDGAYGSAIVRAKLIGQTQLATAYHNYANDLVLLGDRDRALSHARHALSLATAAEDDYQAGKTSRLIEVILREEDDDPPEAPP